MKKFKSLSVDENTFNEVNLLSKSLLPKITLSKSQTIEKVIDIAKSSLVKTQGIYDGKIKATKEI